MILKIMIQILLLVVFVTFSGCDEAKDFNNEEVSLYSKADFPVGVAVDINKLKGNSRYRDIVVRHFNSITAENIMKMDALHPGEQQFNWSDADYLVDFCADHSQRLHGHVLVWHSQVPSWMEDYQGTPEEWEVMLKNHIKTIVSHYRSSVYSWDVVNEAFNDDGELRSTIWKNKLGEDYIAKCYQWAHEADPDAQLFYNDYSLPYFPRKLEAVLTLIDDFKHRDPPVPIDGIGLQMHVTDSLPTIDAIQTTVDSIQSRGLQVHFSEMDISMNYNGVYTELTESLRQRQKKRVHALVTLYRGLPDELKAGITVWGVSDADSWIRLYLNRLDWPLLFDEKYQPKSAYYGFLEAF